MASNSPYTTPSILILLILAALLPVATPAQATDDGAIGPTDAWGYRPEASGPASYFSDTGMRIVPETVHEVRHIAGDEPSRTVAATPLPAPFVIYGEVYHYATFWSDYGMLSITLYVDATPDVLQYWSGLDLGLGGGDGVTFTVNTNSGLQADSLYWATAVYPDGSTALYANAYGEEDGDSWDAEAILHESEGAWGTGWSHVSVSTTISLSQRSPISGYTGTSATIDIGDRATIRCAGDPEVHPCAMPFTDQQCYKTTGERCLDTPSFCTPDPRYVACVELEDEQWSATTPPVGSGSIGPYTIPGVPSVPLGTPPVERPWDGRCDPYYGLICLPEEVVPGTDLGDSPGTDPITVGPFGDGDSLIGATTVTVELHHLFIGLADRNGQQQGEIGPLPGGIGVCEQGCPIPVGQIVALELDATVTVEQEGGETHTYPVEIDQHI